MIRALAAALALLGAGAEGPAAHAHWPLAGADPAVQALVDRGTAMLYAFDVGEARVAFEAAARRAPDLALPYAGAAIAETIDINRPSTREGEQRGAADVGKARAHLAHASAEERALVAALAQRYGPGSERERFARYADALGRYARSHRDDVVMLVLAAYALYNAQDTFLEARDALTAPAREILDDCDRALVLEPENLGAHHLRIHLLEEAERAKDAVPDAEALDAYVYAPGESHLAHMPSHVWVRLGEYRKAIASNERALANDRAWFALGDGPGQAYMRLYHDHDVAFALYGMTTIGRDEAARALARDEDVYSRVELELRLHDDAAALRELWPDAHFERALLSARSGDPTVARAELAKIGGEGRGIRAALVAAALARRKGDREGALAAYRRAYELVKAGPLGDPKIFWATPVGEGYGAALLAAGRPAEAETVFADELRRYPNDPHLAWGLAEAQKAQGKTDDAARAAYRARWEGTHELTLAELG